MEPEEIGQITPTDEEATGTTESTTETQQPEQDALTAEFFPDGTQTPPAEPTTEAEPSGEEKPKLSREDILTALKESELTHDDLKEFDWYNRNLQRQQAALQKEREGVATDNRMRRLEALFTELETKGVLAQAVADPPEYARQFFQQWGVYPSEAHASLLAWQRAEAAKQYRNDSTIAQTIMDGYRDALDANGKYSPVISQWEKITEAAGGDPIKFLEGLTDRVLTEKEKALEKAAMDKARAWLNGELAKRNMTAPGPTRLPAAGASNGNGYDVLHHLTLSGAEADKYEAEHKEEIEAALRASLRR